MTFTAAKVSVVIATRNRRAEVLSSIPHHEAPVILVDNGSTDGTAAAVRRCFAQVRVVELGTNRGASARTLGTRLAGTPYVAFADDDSWWAPGALRRAAEIMDEHPPLALLNARILVGRDLRLDPVCELMAGSPLDSSRGLPGRAVLGFVACASVVRRDAFLAVGGFDDVVRFPGEEERVALDLAAAGWEMAYVEDLVVHHHPSPHRHSPDQRRAAVTRSKLLTACLRLPWTYVRRELAAAIRSGSSGRVGVWTALPDLPAALRQRRRIPPHVRIQLRLLEQAELAEAADPGGPVAQS